MPLLFFPLAFLLLPLIEIAGFVAVGSQIGILATLGLIVATTFAGIALMRVQGLGAIERLRQTLDGGGSPGRDLVHGVMILLAGFLLILPGFVTDVLGFLLFIPPVRDLGWRLLKNRIVVVASARSGAAPWRRTRPGVVDLDSDDYHDMGPEGPDGPASTPDSDRRLGPPR